MFLLRNLIASFVSRQPKEKNDSSASVTLSVVFSMLTIKYAVKYGVKYTRFFILHGCSNANMVYVTFEHWCVQKWLYFLILRHLPYTSHHATTNLIAHIVAKRKSFMKNFKIFLLCILSAIWMHFFLNWSFLQWQTCSTYPSDLFVTCKKSCSKLRLSKWTQFARLLTELSSYYVKKLKKEIRLIISILSLNSWIESLLWDPSFAAVRSWSWSVLIQQIIFLSSYYVYACTKMKHFVAF